jgi:membrane protein
MAPENSWYRKVRAGARGYWDDSALSPEREASRLRRFIHFWVLVCRSFYRNRCPTRASALSYTTLLALIPMLAVVLSVTSGLLKRQGEAEIYRFIDRFMESFVPPAALSTNAVAQTESVSSTNTVEFLPNAATAVSALVAGTNAALLNGASSGTNLLVLAEDERVVQAQRQAAAYVHSFIHNIRSGTLGALGMILLIWAGIALLSRIEETLNDIWGGMRFGAMRDFLARMPFVGSLLINVLLPLAMLSLLFALFYRLTPNTKVNFDAACVGGIVGGTMWQVINLGGFMGVSRMVNNNKIYGGLALIPVFMAGLYLSWFVLLFGAQVAYAWQNRESYLQDKLIETVDQRGREFVALRIMTFLGRRFQDGLPAPTVAEMSGELGVPSRLVQQVLQALVAARLAAEIAGPEQAYAPARPLEFINAHHVLMAMRATQGQELPARDESSQAAVYGEYARIQQAEQEIASGITLLGLVHRSQERPELSAPASKKLEINPPLPVAEHSPKPVAGPQAVEPSPARRLKP